MCGLCLCVGNHSQLGGGGSTFVMPMGLKDGGRGGGRGFGQVLLKELFSAGLSKESTSHNSRMLITLHSF